MVLMVISFGFSFLISFPKGEIAPPVPEPAVEPPG
jgi:hypothetical protein